MHILLLSMPTPHNPSRVQIVPPMSLLCIGGMLRKAGHTSEILNMDLLGKAGAVTDAQKVEQVCARLDAGGYDAVGLNCLVSSQFPFARRLAGAIRDRAAHLPIMLGGMHPTLFAREILTNCTAFDYVILGEGNSRRKACCVSSASPTTRPLPPSRGLPGGTARAGCT